MFKKKIEEQCRGVLESPNIDLLIEIATERLTRLGVTMRKVHPEPWPDVEFSAEDPILDEACETVWHLAELHIRRQSALHEMDLINEENERQRPHKKVRAAKSREAVTARKVPRQVEILNAYAKWAANPKNLKLTKTDFAKYFEAEKRRDGNKRGFGKSTISAFISDFDTRVGATRAKLRLPKNSRNTDAVIALVAEEMKGEPGVTVETVRRALK